MYRSFLSLITILVNQSHWNANISQQFYVSLIEEILTWIKKFGSNLVFIHSNKPDWKLLEDAWDMKAPEKFKIIVNCRKLPDNDNFDIPNWQCSKSLHCWYTEKSRNSIKFKIKEDSFVHSHGLRYGKAYNRNYDNNNDLFFESQKQIRRISEILHGTSNLASFSH